MAVATRSTWTKKQTKKQDKRHCMTTMWNFLYQWRTWQTNGNVFLFLNLDIDLKNSSLQLGYIYHIERVGIILMRFGKNTSSLSLWHFDFFVAVAAVLRKLSSTPGSLLDPLLFLIHIYSVTKNNISDCLLNDDKNSHLKSQRTWYHFFIKTKSRSYEEQGLSMEINSPL